MCVLGEEEGRWDILFIISDTDSDCCTCIQGATYVAISLGTRLPTQRGRGCLGELYTQKFEVWGISET